MRPGLHRRSSLGVDVGHHRPGGFGNAGSGPVGDISGHALVRHQTRPLAHQHTHQLAPRHVADGVSRAHAAVADENRRSRVDAPELQAVPDGREAIHGVGGDGGGGKPVPYHDLHPGRPGDGGTDFLLIFLVKAPPQVRAGQVFVLVPAFRSDLHHAVFGGEVLADLRKYRVLRRRVVGAETEHGQGLVPRPRPAAAQTRRGLFFHFPEFFLVFGVFHQIELP